MFQSDVKIGQCLNFTGKSSDHIYETQSYADHVHVVWNIGWNDILTTMAIGKDQVYDILL